MKYFFLSLFFVLPFVSFAETKTYYIDTGDDAGYAVDSTTYYGNTFTTNGSDLYITSLQILGKRVGTPTTCDIGIQGTSSGYADGTFIVYESVDISAWSTSDEWHIIDIVDTTLSSGTQYAVTVECASASSYFTWRGDSSGVFSENVTWDTSPFGVYSGKDATQAVMYRVYTDVVPSESTVASSTIAEVADMSHYIFELLITFIMGFMLSVWIVRIFLR